MNFLIVLVVMATAAVAMPPVRLLWLYAVGRTHGCQVVETMRSSRNNAEQSNLREKILQGSRKIRRDPQGYSLWDTPRGRYWIPERDEDFLPTSLAEQQRAIYHRHGLGARPGDVVLDCGAHVGTYTREALAAGAKLVVAIEPAPDNLECLRRNLAAEIAGGRVIVYAKGVWDRDDVLMLRLAGTDSAGDSVATQYPGSREGPVVPLTTIDRLVKELNLGRVDFIKMDIEGAEKNAIAGARETITRYKPRLAVAAEHLADDPEAIPAAVRKVWPDYRVRCGACFDITLNVRPDVLYFYH